MIFNQNNVILIIVIIMFIVACSPQRDLGRERETAISESQIHTATPELSEAMALVKQYVDANWRQVEQLYVKNINDFDMQGKLDITLFFGFEGAVDAVLIDPTPESTFHEDFLALAEEIMVDWQVPTVSALMPYRFSRELIAN